MNSISRMATVVLSALSVAGVAHAQHVHDPSQHLSQYADQEPSGIAALSQQELEDLENGAGMGLARAAELNHYPGPLHVLELSRSLELTAEQHKRVRAIHSSMLEQAKTLGAEVLDKERALDMRFAHRHIDEATLEALTAEIGELRGRLRFVHLSAHLETTAVLTPEQITEYDRLRGYTDAAER